LEEKQEKLIKKKGNELYEMKMGRWRPNPK